MSHSVVDRHNPLSFLQQRLNYTTQVKHSLTFLVENVPQWNRVLQFPAIDVKHITSYANSQGETQLLNAICQREFEFYQLVIQPHHVLVTNGAFHGISLLAHYLFRPQAKVLCQTPVLDSVEKIFRGQGYEIVYVNEPDEYAKVIHEVQVIYLNSPHNPSGKVLSKTQWFELLKLAEVYNCYIIADLVYDSFIFDDSAPITPLMLQMDWQNLFVVNSMSKNYGAPGLRIGWIISAATHVDNLTSYLEAECISVCTASQYQAAYLIAQGNQELVDRVKADWLFIKQQLTDLTTINFTIPAGGTQYFVKLPVKDIEAFADFMLVEYGLVLVTSGNYVKSEGAIRIPLGQPRETIVRGLDLLVNGLSI